MNQKTRREMAYDVSRGKQSIVIGGMNERYNFNDIVLNKTTYDAIQDVLVIYQKQEYLFEHWGLKDRFRNRLKAGINLYGPSGTGKTMAAHAIANQLGRKLYIVDYSQIESKYMGDTSKNIKQMFDNCKKTGAILFFDEADALLSRRVTDMRQAIDSELNQSRSVLLKLLDSSNDLVLFATNFISNYDPAFIRRIQSHIPFELPDETNRVKLWRLYLPSKLPTDVVIEELAKKYDGVTGADISNAVFTAALRALRHNDRLVKQVYFEEAIEGIIKVKLANRKLPLI